MRSKLLLSVLIVFISCFSFSSDAVANNRLRKTKKIIYVKKGPNRGRNVIIKKHRRGRTIIIRKNRNGRTRTIVPTRGRKTCVRRR